jgi:hypothetical protein
VAGAIAVLRCALGATAFVLPTLPAGPWVGRDEARRLGARLFARTLGGRDLALGAGLLVALARDEPLSGWAGAAALADAGDLLATLSSFRRLPPRWRWLIVATTLGAAAAGLACLPSVDVGPASAT